MNSGGVARKPELRAISGLIPAAEYVRMSTDHQKYSTENQSETNHAYAARHQMEIVRTYADEGISGLTFHRRDALQQLIKDVEAGTANFKVILVYDVSRWGRAPEAIFSIKRQDILQQQRTGDASEAIAEPAN